MAETVDVLFDATRLVARLGHATPTGIDRVDLAYADALGRMDGVRRHLLVFDALGPRVLSERAAHALVDRAERSWNCAPSSTSSAFDRVRAWLENAPNSERAPRVRANPAQRDEADRPRRHSAVEWLADRARLKALVGDRPAIRKARPVYLNSSHGRLYRTRVGRWLANARIRSVFFVHDLIPLEFPEFNRASEPARHALRLETISRHADRVLVNSDATCSALARHWGAPAKRDVPIDVLPLGIGPAFHPAAPRPAIAPAHPYFVMVGTIEPRKNHALVLDVWSALVARHGVRAPRLVIAGRRGWENRAVFERLDRDPALAAHVAECEGLSDPEVAALVQGARALLMPSFAEGFGLPVAEALSLGTQVLASDLPAHREVGGATATYLDPRDGAAWQDAVVGLSRAFGPAATGYEPPRWTAHFDSLQRVLCDVATTPSRRH